MRPGSLFFTIATLFLLAAPARPDAKGASTGTLSGTVTDAATGEGLAGVEVMIWNEFGFDTVASVTTGPSGRYSVDLPAGFYFATTHNTDGYTDELYPDLVCLTPQQDCYPGAEGDSIVVTAGVDTSGIDFALSLGGNLSGTVTDAATGEPVVGIQVRILAGLSLVGIGLTDETGAYTLTALPVGEYFAMTRTFSDYLNEIWDDVPCSDFDIRNCDFASATVIEVAAGSTVADIDFALAGLGAISGTITRASDGEPIPFYDVEVFDDRGVPYESAFADADGFYTVGDLPAGTYFVTTENDSVFLDELWDDLPCPADNDRPCDVTAGTPVEVALGATTPGIDFELVVGGAIAGTVTTATGEPVPFIDVEIFDETGNRIRQVFGGADGTFASRGMQAGTYYARTLSYVSPFGGELYDDIPCPFGDCDPLLGEPIEVALGETTGNIDFVLAGIPCDTDSETLCLNEGRFKVQVAWEAADGTRGAGQAIFLTSETGYFWFFHYENIELVIKVLDGCFEPFDTFWVFAAGLTDVGVEITVTDTMTGVVRTYVNPVGTPFAPILDTGAFDTCTAGARKSRDNTTKSLPKIVGGPGCATGDTALCLNQGRFLVEASWRTRNGNTGEARASLMTDESGYFWFFSADNVEVVVKVLDACGLDRFNNFWVFAAGLTDVEVTLRVTDTLSGEVNEYFNPLGSAFQPVLDTSAFDTCP